jgi:hypothetical protein
MEILPKLFFIASTHNQAGNGGSVQEPIESDLRDRFTGFRGNFINRLDDCVNSFVGDGGPISLVL